MQVETYAAPRKRLRRAGTWTRRTRARGVAVRKRRRRRRATPGVEVKFYDQKLISGALTAPGDATAGEHNPSATISLNTVVQGDGESNRDGRQIVMNKISIRGNISVAAQADQTAADDAPIVFVALVLDTQTNGALLRSEDVFSNPGASGRMAAQPFHNLQFSKRFRVLKSVTMTLPQQEFAHDGTNLEVAGYFIPFEMHVDLGITTNYSNTSETIANITDNGLNIVAWCSNVGSVPLLNYHSRLRFVG